MPDDGSRTKKNHSIKLCKYFKARGDSTFETLIPIRQQLWWATWFLVFPRPSFKNGCDYLMVILRKTLVLWVTRISWISWRNCRILSELRSLYILPSKSEVVKQNFSVGVVVYNWYSLIPSLFFVSKGWKSTQNKVFRWMRVPVK